jgi:predicted nucleotidyltransferase
MEIKKMIDEKLKLELQNIFKKYKEIEKVLLFGSRARQDNKYNSDVDLCLFGENITHLIQAKVNMDIEEINTPLSFDLLNFNELTKKELIDNIVIEGIEIYNG